MTTVAPESTPASGTHPQLPPRRQLRLVVAGSVDDGKSTLVGRLLYDTKSLLADQYDAVAEASRRRGGQDVDLALVTDGLRAEREQGITIDVAYRYFATPRRSFVLADTPGHIQYTRNTVTGASTADAAVVLVDVRNGVTVQTRRHLSVMALLRVPHVVVAVNKMDAVSWDRERFDQVARQVHALGDRLGLGDLRMVPISALTGQNVAEHDETVSWYKGPSLLGLVEGLDDRDESDLLPFRMPVQLVLRPRTAEHPDYRGLAGRVASGAVTVGDQVVCLPSGVTAAVVAIDSPVGPLATARSGASVTLRLSPELDVGRGQVVAHRHRAPSIRRELEAVVCWLSETTGRPGQRILVKVGTQVVRAVLTGIGEHWHVDDQQWDQAGAPVELNDIARVRVLLADPVAVDDYAVDRATGAFLVIDPAGGATLAAGMVGDPLGTG